MSPRSHNDYQDLLERHISGASLAPDDRFDLFDHIETCDVCRQILEAEERLSERMKTVPRLVAPSDLRSKILQEAIRDHRERTTTPSEDPTVADVLQPRTNPIPAPPASSPDDIPVFAGITSPRQGRLKRAWRKASPVMATGFLAVASVCALYMGQFQGIPFAGEIQQVVWAAVDSVWRHDKSANQPGNVLIASTPAVVVERALPSSMTNYEPAPQTEREMNAQTAPIPGTSHVAGGIKTARGFLESLDTTVASLARAAQEEIPTPAEQSTPLIAALVLKPTDRGEQNQGGFTPSELAQALEAVADSQPGGRVTRQDQFAMGGQRYRLYTLDLPAGCTSQMVETLSPYEAPTDGIIVNALASQNTVNVSRNQTLQFYSSNEAHLRSALETITPVSSSGPKERLRVVVVE